MLSDEDFLPQEEDDRVDSRGSNEEDSGEAINDPQSPMVRRIRFPRGVLFLITDFVWFRGPSRGKKASFNARFHQQPRR